MKNYICGSYIPAGGLKPEAAAKIDFNKITHVFIAFSTLRQEGEFYLPFIKPEVAEGIKILKAEINNQNAKSKLVLSLGGACADFFCEGSRTGENRRAFALRCAEIVDDYGLDGIDMDWEFPGLPHGGISACEHCVHDFTELCAEIRKAIGEKKLLTTAMGSDHWNRLENKELNGILDLVNVMTYDMNNTAHSAMSLTKQNMLGWAENGIDRTKLVLGVPFYARCEDEAYEWRGYSGLVQTVHEGKAELLQDDEQCYILLDGRRLSIDTPESIKNKVQFVKDNGFAGIFNWQELTDFNGELRDAMYGIMED